MARLKNTKGTTAAPNRNRRVAAPLLSHLDRDGRVQMVDVSAKAATARSATASARVIIGADLLRRVLDGSAPKGDVIATAKIAGIQAAKRTSELIPLCHGLSPEHVDVQIDADSPDALRIRATVRLTGKTGVEMEALVAVSVAALTIYDMLKAANKAIEIGPIRLEEKSGGKSGHWRRVP